MMMDRHILFVRAKSSKVPLQEEYESKAAAEAALAQLVKDLETKSIAISAGGGIAISKVDF